MGITRGLYPQPESGFLNFGSIGQLVTTEIANTELIELVLT